MFLYFLKMKALVGILLVAALVVPLAHAATIDKETFIAKADAICQRLTSQQAAKEKAFNQATKRAGKNKKKRAKATAQFLTAVIKLHKSAFLKIQKIGTPTTDQQLLSSFLKGKQQVLALGIKARDTFKKGSYDKGIRKFKQLQKKDRQIRQLGTKFGFRVCNER